MATHTEEGPNSAAITAAGAGPLGRSEEDPVPATTVAEVPKVMGVAVVASAPAALLEEKAAILICGV